MEAMRAVQMTDAAVRLGGREIWSGVDFEVGEGELVAILERGGEVDAAGGPHGTP
jgi:ABC-type transporter Mla maintaining outer membrane lipid asymmetry ATPase subunit MlaF